MVITEKFCWKINFSLSKVIASIPFRLLSIKIHIYVKEIVEIDKK